MAKVQTRRSLSVTPKAYEELTRLSEKYGQSRASIVEEVIGELAAKEGIVVDKTEARLKRKTAALLTKYKREKEEQAAWVAARDHFPGLGGQQ